MTNQQIKPMPGLIVALSITGILSACGSGTGTDASSAAPTDADSTIVEMSDRGMTGTVVVEERNGKTVFDGWFSQTSAFEETAGPIDKTITEDVCHISSIAVDEAIATSALNESPVILGAAQSDTEYASVGQSLSIDSRLGVFESLVEQQAGETTVYAPEERWQSDEVPEDAFLSFPTDSIFGRLGSITIPTLMPLVWVSPEKGVLMDVSSSLRWEPSFNEEVKIKVRLSAVDFSDAENPAVVTVSCDLVDDGLHTLTAEFQQQIPKDNMGIAVYAVRERVQQISGDDSNLTVVQLSYPAPVKP